MFLVPAILTGVRWNQYGFDLHFFMARGVKHFFMHFLAIWTSSFEKALFSLFAYFFIGSLIFFGV
jgi:hypothetical protein